TSRGCGSAAWATSGRWRWASSRWASRPWSASFAASRCGACTSASSACWRWRASRSIRGCEPALAAGRTISSAPPEDRTMRLARLVALAALLAPAWIVVALGQDGKAKKDPQSTFEPRSAPGEGQKFLAKFAGEWEVVKTFHPREGKPAVQK